VATRTWNTTINDREARAALRAFNDELNKQECPIRNKLVNAAVNLSLKVAPHQNVAIISSGHVREDGSSYAALSVCISEAK
jgi:hypothetical protein